MAQQPSHDTVYDIAIIGGGINGCGIARDAAGRGHSVYLCEMADLASGTSSASTKLIHGGLRYLEHYEFRLVREALMEREVLWGIAPHLIRPLRFVLPYHRGLRPAWLLRLGLFLYDHLGGRKRLPPTATLDLASAAQGAALKPSLFATGFAYSDCWVDDARLVVLNALSAAEHGAVIETRTALVSAERRDGLWHATVRTADGNSSKTIRARVLINAAGPWAGQVLAQKLDTHGFSQIRLVQGSHIVVPKIYDGPHCYIFQTGDQRIVFAIPYEGQFTLIGTTDHDFDGDPAAAEIAGHEIDYLCAAASQYFRTPVARDTIVWTYTGVRSLFDDGETEAKSASRDYVLDLDATPGAPPLLTIFGGKITTYRRLAEAALLQLDAHLSCSNGLPAGWTGKTPLPGGDFATDGLTGVVATLRHRYPFLGEAHAERLARAYGTRATTLLGSAAAPEDLGGDFGAGLTQAEVDYLCREEWARSAEDILWRRSKLGLHMSVDQRHGLAEFLTTRQMNLAGKI